MACLTENLAIQGSWRYHEPMAEENRTAQIRKGVVELAVLGLLDGGERYGSQIVDELSAQPALALTAGTVYPLLSRLLKAGLIESTWQESPVGPPRNPSPVPGNAVRRHRPNRARAPSRRRGVEYKPAPMAMPTVLRCSR